jgi:hypothetical protein
VTSRRGSFAVAARLARREVRRHPWRHLLVVGLIYLPVLAALGCFSAVATWKGYEQTLNTIDRPPGGGETYCCAQSNDDGGMTSDAPFARLLPEGTRSEMWRRAGDWLVTDMARPHGGGPQLEGAEVIEASDGSPASPRFVVDDGRLPATAGEIFLTEPLAAAGGWRIGDAFRSARADEELEVVGTGRLADRTDGAAAAVTDQPDGYWRAVGRDQPTVSLADGEVIDSATEVQVAAWPASATARQEMVEALGFGSRAVEPVDGRVGPGLTLASAAICAVVAVVASAAFAIASRRQLRSVGLLATVGTDPDTIRIAMLLQGAIPGLLAGVAAVATGAIVVAAVNATDVVEHVSRVAGSHLVLSWSGAAIAVLLALGAGIAAAWQPARTLSRIPTLSALAGRRPQRPVRSGVPMAGLILWAVGACLLIVAFGGRDTGIHDTLQPFLLILGVAAIALGAVGIAPLLVAALDPLSRRRRGTQRLALRGLSRQRTQSAATVAAISVALAIPVGLLTTRNTVGDPPPATVESRPTDQVYDPIADAPVVDREHAIASVRGDLRSPRAAALTAEVVDLLGPRSAVVRTVALPLPGNVWRLVGAIDETEAARVLEPWAAEAIAAGHAVALRDGPSHVQFTSDDKSVDLEVVNAPNGGVGQIGTSNVDYLVGKQALGGVGASRPADAMIVLRPAPLTRAESAALRRLAGWDGNAERPDPTLAEVQRALAAVPPAADQTTGDTTDDTTGVEAAFVDFSPYEQFHARPPDHSGRDLALAAATGVALLLALLVLTITLSLRNVDGEADQRAALAAGLAPASLRHQRAYEGVVLALLGAVLALPLGWVPVQAARLGTDTSVPHLIDGQRVMITFASPGWIVIPILLVPALVAALAWTVIPAIAARARQARHPGPVDLIAPRW